MNDEKMEQLSLAFKHLMLSLDEKSPEYVVSVADIARVMETLQSCLLRYLQYDPEVEAKQAAKEATDTKIERPSDENLSVRNVRLIKSESSIVQPELNVKVQGDTEETENSQILRKLPIVFLIDESHKLPALINDQLSLKVLFDTLLVMTKQDRLCHVVLSTSDPFFQHFLRSLNIGHHSHIMTIGDCTEEETLSYIREQVLPTVPDELRSRLNVKEIYEAFGGKLSHISDYVGAWINTSGEITPYQSGIFTQAYTLLQLHLTNESFETFSPLSTSTAGNSEDGAAQFTRQELLHVMRHLVKPPYSLPYFQLCREIGTPQVDAMIKTRVLDLRWTKTLTPEQDWVERVWSKDGVERPIVLPMTRIVRRAMEVCLKEESKRQDSGVVAAKSGVAQGEEDGDKE